MTAALAAAACIMSLSLDRTLDDGAGLTLHADIGKQPGPTAVGPSTEVATGYRDAAWALPVQAGRW